MQGLSILADMIVLNLLTLLCSLPLVTAGVAMTALNDVVIRLIRQEGGSLVGAYFRAFRRNLKQGLIFGLLLLLAAGLLYFDYYAALAYLPPLRFGIAAIAVLVLGLAIYVFALMARYENTLLQTIKNAAALAIAYFPNTLGMLAFCLAFWLLCIRYVRWGAPALFMLGFSLPCYVCILLMQKMFGKLEEEKKEEP